MDIDANPGRLDDAELEAAYESLGPRFRQAVEQASRKAKSQGDGRAARPAAARGQAAPSFERQTLPRRRRTQP